MRRRTTPSAPVGALVAALVVAASSLVACGKQEFADRTAQVSVDGDVATFEVDSCGLDEQTLFVVGRSDGGRILQAVVGLEADLETGVPASSGLTVGLGIGGIEVGAFGAESWERQGRTGPPPGRITSARLRGSRIQLAGDAVALDAEGDPATTATTDAGEVHPFSLDARCDEQGDGAP